MHRLTAKALVLVLLLGTLAPFAAAAFADQPYAAGAHCARQSLTAHRATGSECAHHKAAAPTTDSSSLRRDLRSKPCCDEHACCRSQARTQWANVSLRVHLHRSDRTQEPVPALVAQAGSSEIEPYLPVRAPPVR
jgi:hypothetical protein